tara:strand:+ start:279 stop:587 length:309 start_codon:yes stop_codon:yes gene_type:complete
MLNKRGQGLSVTTIIVAIIGLIILVAIILMITGKLGAFGEGVSSVASCENSCKSIGWDKSSTIVKTDCKSTSTHKKKIISGKYSDISDEPANTNACCCERAI